MLAAIGAAAMVGVVQAHTQHPVATHARTARAGPTAAQVMDPRAASAASMAQREALLEASETALTRGMVSTAMLGFEQAAMLLHAADTEMGLVRGWMQQGNYRQALAFAAHTAGAHLDTPAAAALYVWLLRIGGQEAVAKRLLDQTVARAPADPVVDALLHALEAAAPVASGVLLKTPHRMAPPATARDASMPPPGARLAMGGTLLPDGRHALVPSSGVAGARRMWVRNGLGQSSEASLAEPPEAALRGAGFILLQLAAPLDASELRIAERDPFAGSPGFAFAYAQAPAGAGPHGTIATPAWPWLGQGFFGGLADAGGMRRLGIALPAGLAGGPVLNAAGQLAGVSAPGPNGQHVMLPASMLRRLTPFAGVGTSLAPSAARNIPVDARIALDEAYELAMKLSLQVLVD